MPRGRLRDLGLSSGVLPTGRWNAITDVAGVAVGYATLIRDEPAIVRTGVTAIWPRHEAIWTDAVFAGFHSFNGNGEMTGLPWLAEQGILAAPIAITNTFPSARCATRFARSPSARARRSRSTSRSSPRPMTEVPSISLDTVLSREEGAGNGFDQGSECEGGG